MPGQKLVASSSPSTPIYLSLAFGSDFPSLSLSPAIVFSLCRGFPRFFFFCLQFAQELRSRPSHFYRIDTYREIASGTTTRLAGSLADYGGKAERGGKAIKRPISWMRKELTNGRRLPKDS